MVDWGNYDFDDFDDKDGDDNEDEVDDDGYITQTCPTLQDLLTIGSGSLELSLFSRRPPC